MIEASCCFCFVSESCKAFGVFGKLCGQDLNCYVAIDARVSGSINLAHSSRADIPQNLIWTELCSCCQDHLLIIVRIRVLKRTALLLAVKIPEEITFIPLRALR